MCVRLILITNKAETQWAFTRKSHYRRATDFFLSEKISNYLLYYYLHFFLKYSFFIYYLYCYLNFLLVLCNILPKNIYTDHIPKK